MAWFKRRQMTSLRSDCKSTGLRSDFKLVLYSGFVGVKMAEAPAREGPPVPLASLPPAPSACVGVQPLVLHSTVDFSRIQTRKRTQKVRWRGCGINCLGCQIVDTVRGVGN
jgi:hypothetical protein